MPKSSAMKLACAMALSLSAHLTRPFRIICAYHKSDPQPGPAYKAGT